MIFKLRIENAPTVSVYNYATRGGELVYANILGDPDAIKSVVRSVNENDIRMCHIEGRYVSIKNNNYGIVMAENNRNAIIYKKDSSKEFFLYLDSNEDIENLSQKSIDILYDKLNENSRVPLLREWMQYLIHITLRSRSSTYTVRCNFYSSDVNEDDNIRLNIYKMSFSDNDLIDVIKNGLANNDISIGNNNDIPEELSTISGLDQYLNRYSQVLADKISENFDSYFNPRTDKYLPKLVKIDECLKYRGFNLHAAQKDIIQGLSNRLDSNNTALLIGQPGSGKTAMSMYTVLLNAKKPGFNVVLCPGHLVVKWKKTLEENPFIDAVIIESLKEFLALEKKINKIKLNRHLFIILSKDTIKTTYHESPAAVWSESRKGFVCPDCGKVICKGSIPIKLNHTGFLKKDQYNSICRNHIQVYNHKKKRYQTKKCNSKLWSVNIKDENSDFIKLGKVGYIHKKHIEHLYDEYKNIALHNVTDRVLDKNEKAIFQALSEYKNGQEFVQIAPKSYSLAEYINNKYKIDYLIIDEVHQYSGDSIQGDAATSLISASKKVLGLTGTLLNGMASGIFYLLYRVCPELLKRDNYGYQNKGVFSKDYGVVQKVSTREPNALTYRDRKKTSTKELPGVSPLVFTRFLLENAVFISLDDMSDMLPNYTEIPVPVQMDEGLKAAYENFETALRNAVSNAALGGKLRYVMVNSLYTYLDSPYNRDQIFNPDTNNVLVTPINLEERFIRNKEREFIRLVKERIDAGDKVLVYYSFPKTSDVEEFLPQLLKNEGYSIAILKTQSTKKIRDREEWIQQKVDEGVQVLFANPELVETGLDLLDFTSIIYYQISYKLFTLRQSSRRSMRLNQDKDVSVYFMYYKDTIQETALSVMATKLQAAMTIEGKISEEGLQALSDNQDVLTKIANSVISGMKDTVNINSFTKSKNLNKSKSIYVQKQNKTILMNRRILKSESKKKKFNSIDYRVYMYDNMKKIDQLMNLKHVS